MGTHRHRQGDRAGWIALFGRSGKTGHAGRGSHADYRRLTDAEIAEAHRSAEAFAEIEEMTTPLNAFLSLVHAFDWLSIRDSDDQASLYTPYFAGIFGDPIDIALGKIEVLTGVEGGERFARLLDQAREILDVERFFNWQVAFPACGRSGKHRAERRFRRRDR